MESNQSLIVSIGNFILNKPKILDDYEEVNGLIECLVEFSLEDDLKIAIMECVNGKHGSGTVKKEAKYLLGYALVYVLRKDNQRLAFCVNAMNNWNVYREFVDGMKEYLLLEPDKVIALISHVVKRVIDHPEKLVFSRERERFLEYCEKWSEKQNIIDIWRELEHTFFPLHYADQLCLLDVLLPSNVNEFVEILSELKIPILINNLFHMHSIKNYPELVLEILNTAPLCVNEWGGPCDWNGQMIAPVLLDVAVKSKCNSFNNIQEMKSLEKKELEEWLLKLADVLLARADGFYLIYYYIEFLFTKLERYDVVSEVVCEVFCAKFKLMAEKQFVSQQCFDLGVPNNAEESEKCFKCTGILGKYQGDSLLVTFRTRLNFFDIKDNEMIFLRAFEQIFSLEDGAYITDTPEPKGRHYDIARIYSSLPDSAGDWLNTWNGLNALRYRLAFASGESTRIKFLLVVGGGIIAIHYDKNNKRAALNMWKALWRVSIDYSRLLGCCSNEFIGQYIIYLIAWQNLLMVEKCDDGLVVDSIIESLKDIETIPEWVILSIDFLYRNSFKTELLLEKASHREFLIRVCNAALYIIADDRISEAVKKQAKELLLKCQKYGTDTMCL